MPLSKKARAKKQYWDNMRKTQHEAGDAGPQSSQKVNMSAEFPVPSPHVPDVGPDVPKLSYADVVKMGRPKAQNVSQVTMQRVQQVSDDVIKSGPSHSGSGSSSQPSVTRVRASRSQASELYGTSRNKQCVANSLVFLSFLHENENISRADLDLILNKGDVIYRQVKQRLPRMVHLATDELPDKVRARSSDYGVDMTQLPRFGSIRGDTNLLSLEAGLSCLSADVQYALMICAGLGIAVFRCSSGEYGYFDPHPRSVEGLPLGSSPSAGGTAIMLKFTNLREMANRMTRCYRSLGTGPSTMFELQPVMFNCVNRGLLRHATGTESRSTCVSVNKPTAVNESESTSTHMVVQTSAVEQDNSESSSINQTSVHEAHSSVQVMNSDLIDPSNGILEEESVCVVMTSSERQEQVTFTDDQTEQEPTGGTSVPVSHDASYSETNTSESHNVSNVSVTASEEISQKLTKLSKQERKKTKRRLTQSAKTPQRKENQKKKERLKYASDETYQAKKKSYSATGYQNNPDIRQRKTLNKRNQYEDNKEFREKEKARIRKSYLENLQFREKQKAYIRKSYHENQELREKLKAQIRKSYHENQELREKLKAQIRKSYKENPQLREKLKAQIRKSYKENQQLREKLKAQIRKSYKENQQFREKQKAYIRKSYKENQEFREKQRSYIRKLYRENETFQQRQKEFIRNYWKNIEFRQKQKLYMKKYFSNHTYNEKVLEKRRVYMTQRYANDTAFRHQHRQLMKELMKQRYKKNNQFREMHNIRCALSIKRKYRRMNIQVQHVEPEEDNSLIREAISVFRSNIKAGPTYVCTVCHKASFKNQVKECKRSHYVKNLSVVEECLTGTHVHVCDEACRDTECTACDERKKEWICHTCHDHLKKGRMPRLAVANNLELSEIPPELSDLNILERHLIAKCIPFAKIVPLPKGRQRLIRGNLVCVPSEVQETVDALPRLRSESQVMRVKLKRRLCYKGHQLFQTVTWSKLVQALLKLKQIHPQYQDVTIRDEPDLCDPTLESSDSESDVDMDEQDYDQEDLMEIDMCEKSALCDEPEPEPEQDVDMLSSDDEQGEQQRDDPEQDQTLPNGGFALVSCLQPLDISEEILCYSDSTYCVAPAENNSPVSFFKTPKLEAISFPVQFPNSLNTLDERRRIKLTPSAYFKSRLFNIDIRFAKDPNYLFFAQFVTEIYLANSSMTIQLRKGKTLTRDGRRITSGMLQDKREVERLVRNKDAVRFMQPLRGTPAYWQKTTKDLFAMIRQLGTPTFFCTFSAAEMRWPETIKAIKRQQGEDVDFDSLNWSEKCEILRSNPVTSMRMFDKRVEALFRDLLLSDAQPLGKVVDYFYRVEFQHRGSPHIHMMIWVEGAVDPEVDDDQTICDFVDRYISARLPDPIRQPELHKKVSELQKHSRNHSSTCFKSVNSGCRFGFPKPPSKRTLISRPPEDGNTERAKRKLRPLNQLLNDAETASLSLEQLLSRCNLTLSEYEESLQCMNKKTVMILKREPKDSWINGYNPYLLEAWDANIDVSFILNAYSCVEYLTKYITKKESGLSEYLKTVMDNAHMDRVNESDEMRAVMQAYSKKREISAQECVTRACGINMKKSSRSVIFIPTDDNPLRMSRPMSYLENTLDESSNIWMTSLSDKYKSRPETPEYEEMCLADFAATWRFVSAEKKKDTDVFPLLNDMGFVQRRKNNKPAVIRFYHCSQENQPEQFYGRLLRLYLPHRSEQDLKSQRFPTYQSFFSSAWTRLPASDHSEFVQDIVKRNRSRYERHTEDIENALEEFEQDRDHVVDEWCNLAPESEVVRLQCDDGLQAEQLDDEENQENVPDYNRQSAAPEVRAVREPPVMDPAELRQMYQNLNQKQACVFYSIREWCISRASRLNPEPFFLYVNGGAGTGKSHLIKCVYSEASKILSRVLAQAEDADISNPTVLLTAFTGTAAFNISGTTLHSLLKLPRSLKPPIQGLGNQLDEVRSELINAEIIIIDEISMVSKPLFAYVDARLRQIKGSHKPFGGMSVLAVGDFYQLPPVRHSKPLCVLDPAEIDLWQEHFQMITLTQIMRQKDDVAFAEMLNRIRVKEKTDELTQADRDLLSQCITEPERCPTDVLHIFPTNKQVEEHNSVTLALLHSNIISIDADDFQKDPRTGRMERQNTPFKGGRNELSDCLKVAEGARVMLTRNIDISKGLVNGAFAKLVQVVTSETSQHVNKLGLKMDQTSGRNNPSGASEPDNVVYIQRAEDNLKQRGVVRRQFPVKLAFACTVHKTQGLTTDAAVVSLNNIFESGMAYVAVSRVRTLSGLYLLDLDEKKMYANPEITAALQSMRQASVDHMMPLLQVREAVIRPDTLTIVHHNTEGLPAHIRDIRSHHELCLADVLCLTETHLQGSSVSDSLLLDGYTMFRRNRHVSYSNFPQMASRGGGGVAVYVKNHVQVQQKQYLHNVTDLEFVVLKVETPFPALITAVYRPPDYSLRPFMDNLVSLLDSLDMMDCQPIVVCGDFNENQLSGGRKQILELFQSRGFNQLITSVTTDKNTLIDLVFISQPQRSVCSGVLRTYYSYHEPVYCVLSSSQS